MEVTVISEEHVKPSSPTPPHLRVFEHSLLDLIPPTHCVPLILYYSEGIDPNCLKESLSKTLPLFHPLSGRVKDELAIECNDEGPLFVTARVNKSLSEFLSEPDLIQLLKLLPPGLKTIGTSAGTYVSQFQVTSFECGGIAIATCIAHRFLDGVSVGCFLKGWSETARGCPSTVIPDFSASSIFPVDDSPAKEFFEVIPSLFHGSGTGITRRFVFDATAISALKALARSSDNEHPTRVEAVSAFIWKQQMSASQKLNNGEHKTSFLIHVFNLRKRMKPALPEHFLGNILWGATTYFKKENTERSLADLVAQMRRSIENVKSLAGNLVPGSAIDTLLKSSAHMLDTGLGEEGIEMLRVTSWCRFGYYKTDFGCGKPVWMSNVGMGGEVFQKVTILYDTKDGDGVEAWITLEDKMMDVITNDKEMRKYGVLNPCPLNSDDCRPAK